MSTTLNSSSRNNRIDWLRGWLIFLVIVGHVVVGSVHENFVRFAIYGFHMPLFIGLSGYLINIDKLASESMISLLSRYWRRVLLPFALAFTFYTGVLLFHAWEEGRFSYGLLTSYLVSPYYHLWFVPTLVLWVLGFWFALRFKVSISVIMCLSLMVTLTWGTVAAESLGSIAKLLLSKKVIYFFAFFVFGVWLRLNPNVALFRVAKSFKVLPAAVVLLCAVIYVMHIGPDKSAAKGVAWLVMNLALIVISIAWVSSVKRKEPAKQGPFFNILVSMGRISLPIYLWHAVPLFLLKGFGIHLSNLGLYYITSVVSIILIVWLLIRWEGNSSVLDRMVYGT